MLEFSLDNVEMTEFGVGFSDNEGRSFYSVRANENMQVALQNMACSTMNSMRNDRFDPEHYSPAEKYGGTKHLFVPAHEDIGNEARLLHDAVQIPLDADALNDSSNVLWYFARFWDNSRRKLTAVRRATQFKGILNKNSVTLVGDYLDIVEDDVFVLDTDFDILIDSAGIHIWRPTAFESFANVRELILNSAQNNVTVLGQQLGFLDIQNIQSYASTRLRAARYLASIRKQNLAGITKDALVSQCRDTHVNVEEINGRIIVPNSEVMGFLEVLDRRRYLVSLVPGAEERFVAARRVSVRP